MAKLAKLLFLVAIIICELFIIVGSAVACETVYLVIDGKTVPCTQCDGFVVCHP